ncbi:chemotaxis protein CheC [Natronobacterium gregoryi]|uniref:Chemotaxis protein CheA n=2 Tax=Natronobacterium gregoryi TaxID=44930 RepID=L0AJC6_NATGS|nr:chemotaxis protein CheC [Natronobacterium gregoryi]AFZ73135.1 chemotaxis protein CheC, inhibitor of MCP methylation [Natronobacterium gregoryi SP2]ELY70770.1 inhibitor of MCP methylation CheC [Natronobacterium gregoryi SP2]PLK21546.1 chemotaxis protein CheA [Natronobacterium gregoryi SP2]SFI60470.1 chemotaxis protein CheC [Natronobacterium gregoryi]
MEIDIRELETYQELAHDGAQAAADSLSQLTGIGTNVRVTNVSLMSPEDLENEFFAKEFAGVCIDLSGEISGQVALAFDEQGREAITDKLVPADDPEKKKSSIKEVGNIMTSGFVDGWANYLNATIKSSPPTYIQGQGTDILPVSINDIESHLFVFRSRVEVEEGSDANETVDFRILLIPDSNSLERTLKPKAEDGVSFEKLEVFTDMTKEGAQKAATNITSMTGIDTTVNISRLTLVPIEDIPKEVGTKRYVGTVMEYDGKISGYLVILFDQPSGRAVVDALVPMETDGQWDEMEQEALKELSNIMTSGFVDGWANVLSAEIKHQPPNFVADTGTAVMTPVTEQIGKTDDHAFLLDSSIETNSDQVFTCQMLALPHRNELEAALEDLLVENTDNAQVNPDDLFD